MRRVTADSNIYISALNFGGKPLQVLELARAGQIELAISNAIIPEVSRILHYKFDWKPEDIEEVVQQILGYVKYLQVDYTLAVVPTDADDNRVLECALRPLVTGGVITAGIAMYEHFIGQTLLWHACRWALVAYVTIAVFLAWRQEHSLASQVPELQKRSDNHQHSTVVQRRLTSAQPDSLVGILRTQLKVAGVTKEL